MYGSRYFHTFSDSFDYQMIYSLDIIQYLVVFLIQFDPSISFMYMKHIDVLFFASTYAGRFSY